MTHFGYSPVDLVRIPWRHKFLVLFFFLLASISAVAVIRFWPRSYVSEAKLFLRLGRESVTLDPTTKVGDTISINESREQEINSALEVMQSRELATMVVNKLGAEYVISPPKDQIETDEFAAETIRPTPVWLTQLEDGIGRGINAIHYALGNDTRPTSTETAITKLQKRIHIEPSLKKSNVITVACQSQSASSAQRIVQTLVDSYLDTHVRINQAKGSLEFFELQTNLLHKQLNEAKQKLRDEKTRGGLASLEGMRTSLEQQHSHLVTQIANTRSATEESRATAEGLEQMLGKLPTELIAEKEDGYDNVAVDEMRALLYELQILEKDLQAKFTESHPRVTEVRGQVEQAMGIIEKQSGERTHTKRSPNPAFQQLQVELIREKAQLAGLEAKSKTLIGERELLDKEIAELNAREILLVDLTRQISLLDNSYASSYEALEQSRISNALESEQVSNITVLQSPTYIAKPTSPKKFEVLALAMFVGLAGGVALSFLAEQMRGTIRTAEEIEGQFKIPVLAHLPIPHQLPRVAAS